MSRIESNNLTEILKSYTRRDTLLLYLNDQTTLPLSRGAVVRDGVTYKNYIRSVGDLSASFDRAVDNIEITCQNVNSELGYNLASNYKRRNGMLAGQFTGMDTLPSMLAAGEMVLNPAQIAAVINNAGGSDVFKGAGIPNYATGTYLPPSLNVAPSSAAISSTSASESKPQVIQIFVANSGMVESDITDVVIDGFQNNNDVQVELVKAVNKGNSRNIK